MDAQDDWLDEPPGRPYKQDSGMFPPDIDDPQEPHYNWVQVCLISAMGLAVGVMGTAAYVIWFGHDQDAYADAVQSAQRPPTATAVIPGANAGEPSDSITSRAVTGRVMPATDAAQANDSVALGPNETIDDADSAGTADPADDSKPAAHPALAANGNAALRNERNKPFTHRAVKAKPKENFFSRVSAMFRKVAWHRDAQQGKKPDPYSHP